MNYKKGIILFLANIFSMTLLAQNAVFDTGLDMRSIGHDSLIIERLSGHKIKLIWDSRKNIKKIKSWEELYEDFQSNFKKIYDDVPDFEFYKIDYDQDQRLIIDEISGRETYTVNEKDEITYTKANLCKLNGKEVTIYIEFNDKNELIDTTIRSEIRSAISKVKHRFYFSEISRQRHFYSVEENKMVKPPKPSISIIFPVGASIGMVKNQPYVELRPGIGLLIGHNNLVSLNANVMIAYDELTNESQHDVYLGINWMPEISKGLGVENSIRISNGIDDFEDLAFRARLNYKTKGGILLGFDYYLRKEREDRPSGVLWGFHLGFGF